MHGAISTTGQRTLMKKKREIFTAYVFEHTEESALRAALLESFVPR